jgi:hypothetical protein
VRAPARTSVGSGPDEGHGSLLAYGPGHGQMVLRCQPEAGSNYPFEMLWDAFDEVRAR